MRAHFSLSGFSPAEFTKTQCSNVAQQAQHFSGCGFHVNKTVQVRKDHQNMAKCEPLKEGDKAWGGGAHKSTSFPIWKQLAIFGIELGIPQK
jgi:hypothetical protein